MSRNTLEQKELNKEILKRIKPDIRDNNTKRIYKKGPKWQRAIISTSDGR